MSSSPWSGRRRNTTSCTPRVRAAARCSSSRIGASNSGVRAGSLVPFSPLVQTTYVTRRRPSAPTGPLFRRHRTRCRPGGPQSPAHRSEPSLSASFRRHRGLFRNILRFRNARPRNVPPRPHAHLRSPARRPCGCPGRPPEPPRPPWTSRIAIPTGGPPQGAARFATGPLRSHPPASAHSHFHQTSVGLSRMRSSVAPTRVATTGVPQASASSATIPKLS